MIEKNNSEIINYIDYDLLRGNSETISVSRDFLINIKNILHEKEQIEDDYQNRIDDIEDLRDTIEELNRKLDEIHRRYL